MSSSRLNEKGMISVEAVLSLVPFMIAILGIISFTNIFAVHNKIQYALQQMCNELSCYTYFYEALGLRAGDLELKKDADESTEKLDSAVEEFTNFLDQVSTFEESLGNVSNSDLSNVGTNISNAEDQGKGVVDKGIELGKTARELASDPKALLRGFVYLGIEKTEDAAKEFLMGLLSGGFLGIYLDSSFSAYQPMSADEYLKHFGVKGGMSGLDFKGSGLFTDDKYRLIDVVVEYDLEVYLFKLFMKDPHIHVVQRCTAPAWLDGDGVKYSK